LIADNDYEISADNIQVLLQNMSLLPLSVIALSPTLTNQFTSRGSHTARDDRRQAKVVKDVAKKKKNLSRALLPELATPTSTGKESLPGSYVGEGELNKKGLPKQKMGRKAGTKMVDGKAVPPENGVRPKKAQIQRSQERPCQANGETHFKDAALTKRVSYLERENEEHRKTITQLQAANNENVDEAIRNDYKLRAALDTRTAIAKFIAGDKISPDTFREISPMKKLRLTPA